jgi:hypothetical protein
MISVIHKNSSYVLAWNIVVTGKVTTYMFKDGCEFLSFSVYLLPFSHNIFLCLQNCIYKKMTLSLAQACLGPNNTYIFTGESSRHIFRPQTL